MAFMLCGCLFAFEREGFKEEDLLPPLPYFVSFEEKPPQSSFLAYSASYEVTWKISPAYSLSRCAFKIYINNTGESDIFVYGFAIKINGREQISKYEHGKEILRGENKSFIFSFLCPEEGNHSYKLGVYFMAGKGRKWYDHGLKYLKEEKYIEVKGFESKKEHKFYKNYFRYFDKINELVNPFDPIIKSKANEITSKYGSSYNIAKICAIFDWVYENVEYKKEEKDEWNKPSYAIFNGGDCEEFAMLISALISAIGGNARIYLTDNHAFSSIYIGKNLSLLECIDAYYSANLTYAIFEDEFGYWLVADPLSYFYLGCLPVGSAVAGEKGNVYDFYMITSELHAIDVLGK
ncbi:MAG: transglutaminase domain-containing protein [Thermoplasmatales archaeon]|nr:transglutaminase domain-containing protein [Thermoplasmatales archaeon]